jgi:xylan 1,4-beta-xylosidase
MYNTIVMGISEQSKNIVDSFIFISSYSQLRNMPVVIGESDSEGCAACGMETLPRNAYHNGTTYSTYRAVVFPRAYALAKRFDADIIGARTWAFEFENQSCSYSYIATPKYSQYRQSISI